MDKILYDRETGVYLVPVTADEMITLRYTLDAGATELESTARYATAVGADRAPGHTDTAERSRALSNRIERQVKEVSYSDAVVVRPLQP